MLKLFLFLYFFCLLLSVVVGLFSCHCFHCYCFYCCCFLCLLCLFYVMVCIIMLWSDAVFVLSSIDFTFVHAPDTIFPFLSHSPPVCNVMLWKPATLRFIYYLLLFYFYTTTSIMGLLGLGTIGHRCGLFALFIWLCFTDLMRCDGYGGCPRR